MWLSARSGWGITPRRESSFRAGSITTTCKPKDCPPGCILCGCTTTPSTPASPTSGRSIWRRGRSNLLVSSILGAGWISQPRGCVERGTVRVGTGTTASSLSGWTQVRPLFNFARRLDTGVFFFGIIQAIKVNAAAKLF